MTDIPMTPDTPNTETRTLARPHTTDSIRYDLVFAECVSKLVDAHLEREWNSDSEDLTFAQEADQRDAYAVLCDIVDKYAERRTQWVLSLSEIERRQ